MIFTSCLLFGQFPSGRVRGGWGGGGGEGLLSKGEDNATSTSHKPLFSFIDNTSTIIKKKPVINAYSLLCSLRLLLRVVWWFACLLSCFQLTMERNKVKIVERERNVYSNLPQ